MADNITINISKSTQIRNKLKVLDCPYLESLDDVTTHELLFSNGEARLRLLEWLLNKYDSQLLKRQIPPNTSRIAKLTIFFSELQLCTPHDHELIKGNASNVRSLMFWEALTDLVLSVTKDSTKNKLTVSNCYNFIDEMCSCHGNLTELFPNSINLIPHTISHVIKGGVKRTVPSLAALNEQISDLNHQLNEHQSKLDDLSKKHIPVEYNTTTMTSTCTCLHMSLSTLNQLIDNFIHFYNIDLHQWTSVRGDDKGETDIGQSIYRLHTHLSIINQLLESINKLTIASNTLISLGQNIPYDRRQGNNLYKRSHVNFDELIDSS